MRLTTSCREAAGRTADNYGQVWYQGRQWRAHRAEWHKIHDSIPDGMHVLHHCDNPPCFEITHLFLGTNADNIEDKVAKGRQPKGTDIHWSKLTPESVKAIRHYRSLGYELKDLAPMFNVSKATISRVANGVTWRHVT